MEEYLIYGIIMSLSFSSLVSLLPGRSTGRYASTIGASVAFVLSLRMLGYSGFENQWFCMDRVAVSMVAIITLTYLLATLHSLVCLDDVRAFYLPQRYYWSLLALFALTMVLAVSSPNIGYSWFWLEASTVVSASLILVERGKSHVESAWRYILIASAGLGMALLSVILFGWATGSFVWYGAEVSKGVELIGVLALLGFGAKAGLFPVHTWLPDAHGTAPSTVSAMLSGALLPTALLVYYRMFTVLDSQLLFHLTVAIGLLTLWVAGFLMIAQKRIKRLLAYSSMDVMGIGAIGIGLTYASPGVINYVILLFAAHALGKSSLFLSAGVLKRMGYAEISRVRNLMASPVIATAFVISALTVTGAPPFPMFFGEFGILTALSEFPYAFAFLLGGILLSFFALNYHVLGILFKNGDENDEPGPAVDAMHSAVPFAASMGAVALSFIIYGYLWGWFS